MKHIIDDADKNKYEALSKAEVIALLQQVIESGQLPEGELEGLVLSLKNPIDNLNYKIAFCSQAKYNELKAAEQLETNCYYIITDDTSYDDINNAIQQINRDIETTNNYIDENKHLINNVVYENNHLELVSQQYNFTSLLQDTIKHRAIIRLNIAGDRIVYLPYAEQTYYSSTNIVMRFKKSKYEVDCVINADANTYTLNYKENEDFLETQETAKENILPYLKSQMITSKMSVNDFCTLSFSNNAIIISAYVEAAHSNIKYPCFAVTDVNGVNKLGYFSFRQSSEEPTYTNAANVIVTYIPLN